MWADELAAFAVSTVVTGDFSLSVRLGGPWVLSTLWATKASISLFWSNSALARPGFGLAAECIPPSATQSGEPPFLCPAWQDLFSSDQLLAPFLCGRHDFKITNNVRLSPRLCSTQRVSRKDHSDRSSGGVTLVTSVDPVSCATFRNFFL